MIEEDENGEYEWKIDMSRGVPADQVPDHLAHEADEITYEMCDALNPIADRTRPMIFMRALNQYYFTYLLIDVFRDDIENLREETENLVDCFRKNIEAVIEVSVESADKKKHDEGDLDD